MGGAIGPIGPGVPGATGATGATGPAAPLSLIPNAFLAITTPQTLTLDATFSNIPGVTTTVTPTTTVPIAAWAAVEWSAGASVMTEWRLVIDGQNGDASHGDTSNGATSAVLPISFTSTALVAGEYTVKLQGRKVSGAGDVTVEHVDLTALAMQGGGG